MPAGDEWTYENLVNRWRKETRSDGLGRLEGGFYEGFEAHLRNLAEEYQRENSANPLSPKATILQDELRNLQRARDDIYDARERKIVISAIIAARGGNPDRSNLTRGELELYEALVRTLKEARRTLVRRGEMQPATTAPSLASVVGVPAAPPEPPANPIPPLAAPAARATKDAAPTVPEPPLPGLAPAPPRELARVYVQVLQSVPPFVGSDLRTYALAPDDIVAVPAEAAALLAEKGFARKVQTAVR